MAPLHPTPHPTVNFGTNPDRTMHTRQHCRLHGSRRNRGFDGLHSMLICALARLSTLGELSRCNSVYRRPARVPRGSREVPCTCAMSLQQ